MKNQRSASGQLPAQSIRVCAAVLLAGCATMAGAQTYQQRYDQLIARCNDGTMPRPERDACVRDAGLALERARQGSSGGSQTENRSTVIVPDGASRAGTDSSTEYTSQDGRAVIVPPAGSPPPADAVTQ
ncbi:hypothetical protein QTH87_20955 [Variovorax sp. J22P168]|uniref:hypothetical protein n=1 Tax=Variovorax jilinensis TaxID=3053513 RepID=UPI002574ABED|nr:hypothetical protein [Variovorax sp. J22P168]MDM0014927.1 hypothetical protein [Variovorax sp. J22P168]